MPWTELELFPRVADADPTERERLLAQARPQVAQRVRRMLSADAAAFTEHAQGAIAQTLEPPGQVGPFRLVSELGRGGMGRVFLAEQALPRRRVAVKLMHPGPLTPEAIARFHAEVETLATLRHPTLPFLIQAGQSEGWLWLAMELVRGPHLDAWDGTPDQAHALMVQLAWGVHHAHIHGIAHLDLKPSNVLVTPQGVRILDFGIARLAGTLGLGAGTPGWRPPEQVAGRPVDLRSDVYNLGRLGELVLDPVWAPVLARATAGDPDDRYANAGQFAQALLGETIPAATSYGAVLNQLTLTPEETDLVAAIAADSPRNQGATQMVFRLTERLDAGELVDRPALEARLRVAAGRTLLDLEEHALALRQVQAAQALAADTPSLRGQAHLIAGSVHRRMGDLDGALTALAQARASLPAAHPDQASADLNVAFIAFLRGDWATAQTGFARHAPHRTDAQGMLAKVLSLQGRHDDALEQVNGLLAEETRRHGPASYQVATAYSKLGQLHYERERFAPARDAFANELAILQRRLGPENPKTASSLKWLAGAQLKLGHLDDALQHAQRAATIQRGDPFEGLALKVVAMCQLARGEPALETAEAALASLQAHMPDHFQVQLLMCLVAQACADQDPGRARALLDEALPLLEARFGADSPRIRTAIDLRAALSETG